MNTITPQLCPDAALLLLILSKISASGVTTRIKYNGKVSNKNYTVKAAYFKQSKMTVLFMTSL